MIGRVVFDTSTLAGAVLKAGSKPYRALALALGSCTICSCEQAIAELADVLSRTYFDRNLSRSDRDDFLALLRENAAVFHVSETAAASVEPRCRDERDHFILALAVISEADVIVSSDSDLLVLHPWRGIRILTPADFLMELSTRGDFPR